MSDSPAMVNKRVYCSQFARCRWTGTRKLPVKSGGIVGRAHTKQACPRCGAGVVA